jgi:hypothetical protein
LYVLRPQLKVCWHDESESPGKKAFTQDRSLQSRLDATEISSSNRAPMEKGRLLSQESLTRVARGLVK